MTISPGENLGPYRIMEQLGSGGMATVFKAYHPSLDRYVAVKLLHPALKQDPQFFERFRREARIVAKLEHSNIIPVYDFNEHQGEPYLVMCFVDGQTLKSKMDGAALSSKQILQLMRPVCQALDYAHSQGVLHRDIKPSNIMITNEGTVLLTDFGLARMVQPGESTLSQDVLVGTPQYISPEQAQGMSQLDGRSDIYSLGVVLYEIITGRVPFNADTPFATVHDHIYSPLPLPTDITPNIDPVLERLLLKTLAKNPGDRYPTASDLLQALETTLNPQPDIALRATPAAKKRGANRWWIWVGAAELYRHVLAADPQLLAGYFGLSQALNELGESEAGTRVLETAVQNNPDSVAALVRLGENQLFSRRNPEAALDVFEQATTLEPGVAGPYAGQAIALVALNRSDEAKQAIETAFALEPDSAGAHLANAFYLNDQGRRLAALQELRQIIRDEEAAPLIRARARPLLNQMEN